MRRLTAKQELFARACLTMTQSDAYRSAYDTKDMAENGIWDEASKLARNPLVSNRIKDLRDIAAESTVVEESTMLREAMRLAYSDPINLFDEEGNLLPLSEMSPATRAAIASMDVEETYAKDPETGKQVVISRLRKVRLWEKNSALEKLFKNRGAYEQDNKQRAGLFDAIPRERLAAIEGYLNGVTKRATAVARGSGVVIDGNAAGSPGASD